MFPPSYICPFSLIENKTKMMGNLELAEKIKKIVQEYIENGKNLYQTQDELKKALIRDFNEEWYKRSGEAINYIIENEYANIEREESAMKQYEAEMKLSIMY